MFTLLVPFVAWCAAVGGGGVQGPCFYVSDSTAYFNLPTNQPGKLSMIPDAVNNPVIRTCADVAREGLCEYGNFGAHRLDCRQLCSCRSYRHCDSVVLLWQWVQLGTSTIRPWSPTSGRRRCRTPSRRCVLQRVEKTALATSRTARSTRTRAARFVAPHQVFAGIEIL